MASDYYLSKEPCGNIRRDPDGKKWVCLHTWLNRETNLCQSCTPKNPIVFATQDDELLFLRNFVSRLIRSQGRETVYQSMDLDYAWDMLEEYVENNLDPNEY